MSQGKRRTRITIHNVRIDPALEIAGARYWDLIEMAAMKQIYRDLIGDLDALIVLRGIYERQCLDRFRLPCCRPTRQHLN